MKINKRNILTVILSALCAVLLCSSVVLLNGISSKKADAQTSAYTVTVDEIYKGNGKTTVSTNESVFDGINMQKLYAQITGDADADYSTVAALASDDVTATTLSANAKKINSSYNDIIVKFAGLDWTATLLTTDSDQNVVLTLWLASHYVSGDPLVDQWNTQASNANGPYPNAMYGTSYMRASVLNNGGNYAATYNATTLTDVAQDADNTFARFTMSSVNDNVTQFLVKPANVAISSKSSFHRNDVGVPYFGNSSDANVIATYTRWLEDLLWLPSSTEVLSGNLWQTTATQRTNTSTAVWTRSAGSGHYYYARVLTASGTDAYYTTNSRYGIRPALYLNLTLAEGNASEVISVPTVDKTEGTYDPSATQSFTLDYDDTKVSLKSLTAKTTSGGTIASSTYSFNQRVLKATEAGTYTMTFEIVQSSNPDQLYEWQDSETNQDDTRTVTVTIKRKEFVVPTINNSTQTYKGTDYYFDLSSQFNATLMSIGRPNGITDTGGGVYSDGLSYDSINKQFSAKNAGTYNVVFKLKDTANTIWSVNGGTTADQTVPITINKKALTFTYTPTNANMEWGLGDSGSVTLTTPTVCTGDSVGLYLYYVNASGNEFRQGIAGNVLDVSKITSTGEFTLCAKLITDKTDTGYIADNENYEISGDGVYKLPANIVIKAAGVNANSLNWQYRQTDEIATKDLIIGGSQVPLQYTSDKQYYVTALGNDYMEIYSSYNSNDGYVNGFKTVDSNGNVVTNGCSAVGKYTTYVAIHITNPDYAFKPGNMLDTDDKYGWLSLEWEITPRELDFANAEWQYTTDGGKTWKNFNDGMPEYTGFNIAVQIDPDYIRGLGLDPDTDINISYSGDILKNNKTESGQNYKAVAGLEIFNASYKTPDTSDGSDYTIDFEWRITNKQIGIKNWNSSITVTLDDGRSFSVPAITSTDGADYSQYIVYTYTAILKDENGQDYVFTGTGEAALKTIGAQASLSNEISVTATASIIATKQDSFDLTGTLTKEFTMGSSKATITVNLTYNNVEYGSVQFGITATNDGLDYMEYIQVTLSGVMLSEPVTVDGSNLSALTEYLVNAGEYNIVLVLDDFVSGSFALSTTTLTYTIVPKQVYIPEVGREIIFTGENITLTDYLDGYDPTLMTIDALDKRDAGTVYTATITLKDQFNYVFVKKPVAEPETESAVKTAVKAALTGYENSTEFANDEHTAALLKWQINPYVLDSSLWNLKGNNGAVLNLPAQFAAMLSNGTLDLSVGYRYYEDAAGGVIDPEFKPGNTFYADAFLEGADASNFVFENGTIVSDKVTYSVPKSGITAIMSNVKDFVTKTWLGLPIWAWLLIGLFLLILLIIIIVVACKRRKSKEERAEAKARKEEERQLQREKLEAERELAKAKQEAELEKIRAQAGLAAGAGMAGVAMQQPQPQPQAQPQPVQQQMPMQQPVMSAPAQISGDVAFALAKIEAELAQLRANQNVPHGNYMPAAGGSDYHSIYAEERARAAEAKLLEERVRIEERARAAEQRAMLAEERYWRGGMQGGGNAIPAEVVVALLQAVNNGGNAVPVNTNAIPAPAPAALPQNVEESTQSTHAQYPSDAVITTTTTVDTTQKSATQVGREINRTERSTKSDFIDVDGFYDEI